MPKVFDKFWKSLRFNIGVLDQDMLKIGLESSCIVRPMRYNNKFEKPYGKIIFQKNT
jgi:hypothetical protein